MAKIANSDSEDETMDPTLEAGAVDAAMSITDLISTVDGTRSEKILHKCSCRDRKNESQETWVLCYYLPNK